MEVAQHSSVRLSEIKPENMKEYVVRGISPEAMFRHFEDISAIPRGSGNEAAVARHICDFAAEHGLEYYIDSFNNVLIKRPASAGYEDRPAVLLQGHTDMVCEKNSSTVHDFLNDPLELYIDGPYLCARGTTLGGDDGIAVAIMMALLEENSVPLPALECLFTVDEEQGLTGAENFDYSRISADTVINLDSEEEGCACVSSAGGMNNILTFDMESVPFRNRALKIHIFGLAGGHSGEDINKCRTSANVLMGRVLGELYAKYPFSLVSLEGGNMRNAISRESTAVISTNEPEATREFIAGLTGCIYGELGKTDRGFRLHVDRHSAPETMFTLKSTSAVLSALTLAPAGVLAMCPAIPDMVETSTNLGLMRTEGEKVVLTWLSRSSVESRMDHLQLVFERLAKVTGAKVEHKARYGGWRFRECGLQKRYIEAQKSVTGKEGRLVSIHAGLECGTVVAKLEALHGHAVDCISIGPDIIDIHSPDEKLDIASCERLYRVVLELLKADNK